jgi:hypothetical protein
MARIPINRSAHVFRNISTIPKYQTSSVSFGIEFIRKFHACLPFVDTVCIVDKRPMNGASKRICFAEVFISNASYVCFRLVGMILVEIEMMLRFIASSVQKVKVKA